MRKGDHILSRSLDNLKRVGYVALLAAFGLMSTTQTVDLSGE